jgi:hypothetical protein
MCIKITEIAWGQRRKSVGMDAHEPIEHTPPTCNLLFIWNAIELNEHSWPIFRPTSRTGQSNEPRSRSEYTQFTGKKNAPCSGNWELAPYYLILGRHDFVNRTEK